MKNLTIILLLFFLPTILIGQNLKALDKKYGFKEAKFEKPLGSFKNMVEIREGSGLYQSTSENLSLGEYALDGVTYQFYKGQLYSILIEIKGYSNCVGVLKILQEDYGKGYQSNEYIEEYFWSGKKVSMFYQKDSITNDVDLFLISKKLRSLKEADEKRANSEAAKKL